MRSAQRLVTVLCLAAALGAATARADAVVDAGAAPAARPHHGGHGVGRILHRLNLSADQRTQVRSILAQARPQLEALHAASRQNRLALASTAPIDPGYPALVEVAKANAAARIQLHSDLRSQVYAILTPAQQAAVPGLVAAEQAAAEARRADWHARHRAS